MTMMKKKKVFFVFLSILLSLILIISTLEIAVRIIVSNGLNLDIEMLKYAKSLKVISENKNVLFDIFYLNKYYRCAEAWKV